MWQTISKKNHLEVLKALFYGVAAKAWGLINIPIQLLLISFFFSPEMQGYFYTFQALLGLQAFVELGLATIIVHFTAHEWSQLRLNSQGEIEGDEMARQRLAQFGHFVFKFYGIGACLFILLLLLLGPALLARQTSEGISWFFPWMVFAIAAGGNLMLIPALAFLEGANQMKNAYLIRFGQSVVLGLTTWVGISSGFNLWTCSLALFSANCWMAAFFCLKYRRFFKVFFIPSSIKSIAWKEEIFPWQWRMGVSSLTAYFAFSLFNPLAFYFKGAIFAGKLGMTLALTQALLSVSFLWVNIYTPQFGALIAQKKQQALETLFAHTQTLTRLSILIFSLLAWICIKTFSLPFIHRLLPSPALEYFLIGNVLFTLSLPYSVYIRAHKQEPLLLFSMCYAGLVALTTYITMRFFSANELSFGLLVINGLTFFFIRMIWNRFLILKEKL